MNLRPFFKNNHWWGKILGAGLGYLIYGPPGSIAGILIGNLFDQGLAEQFSKPHYRYTAEKRKVVQQIFFEATFTVMGHIAKAGGRVSEEQISMVKRLMNDMQLSTSQRTLAQNYFREGKKRDCDIWRILNVLRDVTRHNPELLNLFIDMQYQAALVGGLSARKQQLLNTILHYLGYAPLYQQHRFYEDVSNHQSYRQTNQDEYQSNYSNYQQSSNGLEHAYGILGITRTANKQEVKKAYRQLISRNHPDKLIAKGLPESMIKMANEKTQQIRKAYEQICAERGW